MRNFDFYSPTYFVFGKDREAETGRYVKRFGGSRVLVVYGGQSAKRSGLLDRIMACLKEENLYAVELGGVKPNPRSGLVYEGIDLCRREKIDFILAVGGGSVIDTAKAIAYGLAEPDKDVWELYEHTRKAQKCLPVASILTIAAAGSETSNSSVITREDTHQKRAYNDDLSRPKFAIMDPELTYTLPRYQVGCGVVDIMMHTLERYFNPGHPSNRMTDEIAEGLLRTVIDAGRVAMQDSHNYDAMSEIMWAGSLSHNNLTGLGGVKDFSVHQFGHELSGMFDAEHGLSLIHI